MTKKDNAALDKIMSDWQKQQKRLKAKRDKENAVFDKELKRIQELLNKL